MVKIIADDLGLYPSVNEGIILALEKHWIDGASIMANGEAFDDAIRKIKSREIRFLNIGIHLVLVEEKPLSNLNEIKTLVKDGRLVKNYKVFFINYILGRIDLKEIEKEFRLQIEKCLESGIRPRFLNSHQHLHLLPGITNIIVKLAKEFDISYVRVVNEPFSSGQGQYSRKIKLLVLRFLSYLAKRKIKKAGLECNDFFVGFINSGSLKKTDIDFAKKLNQRFPNDTIELGCHPGYEDDALREKYKNWIDIDYNWRKELDLLKQSAA